MYLFFLGALGVLAVKRFLESLDGYGRLADVYLAALEFDHAVLQREERVILALADVETGAELGSALTEDDRPGEDRLPAVGFHAKILRIAVAAVPGGTRTFLMSHKAPK